MAAEQTFKWTDIFAQPFVFGARVAAEGAGLVVSGADKVGAFAANAGQTAGAVTAAGLGAAAVGTAAYFGLFVLGLYFVLRYGGKFARDVAKIVPKGLA